MSKSTAMDVDTSDVKVDLELPLEAAASHNSGHLSHVESWPSSLHSSPDPSPEHKKEPQKFKDSFYNQFEKHSHDSSRKEPTLPSSEKKVKASKAKLAKRTSHLESRNDIKKFSGRTHGGLCCFGSSRVSRKKKLEE